MPWFDALIPGHLQALILLDWLLHTIHLTLIAFVMFGWLIAPLRKLHLIMLTLVWFSWLGLGLYVGHLGYCVLTDWQWQVKAALGETYLPPSYPEYLYWRLTGGDIDNHLMAIAIAAVLIACSAISLYLHYRRPSPS